MVSRQINAKLGGTIMKPKHLNFLPFGFRFLSKENTGQVIYKADMCCGR